MLVLLNVRSEAQTWLALASGLGSGSESVKAIAVDTVSGSIYAGGTFTGSINYLAKWNGTSWEQLGTGIAGPVFALAIKGQDLYVGGSFTDAGGIAVNNIAKWSSGSWSDVNGGFNGQVNCIFLSASQDLYAGGTFSLSGLNTMNHVSKLVNDVWTQVGSGINSVVNTIVEHGGSLYAGCDNFSDPVQKFDGSSWGSVGGVSGGKVFALASFGNFLYAGGDFSIPTPAASKFDGTSWGTIQTIFNFDDKIYAFSTRTSVLYIGGKFTNQGIPNLQASYVARINSPITPIQTITLTTSELNGEVYAIGNLTGKVIAGGKFSSPGANIVITSTTIDVNEMSDLVLEKNFFPNPVNGKAQLIVTTKEKLKNPQLEIYDLQSRLISNLSLDKKINNKTIEFNIDCANLPAGNYSYKLIAEGTGILSDKFVISQ